MKPQNALTTHLELQALYQISQLIGSALDIRKTLDETLRILHETLRMERATLVLEEDPGGQLTIVASYGLSRDEISRGIYRPGEGVIGRIFANAYPFVVPDIHNEPLFLNRTGARTHLPKGEISFIGVPVMLNESPVGVLSVDRLFGPEVSFEEDIRFLTVVATLIAQFLSLQRTFSSSQQILREENSQLREALSGRGNRYGIIGASKRIQEVYRYIAKVAPSSATALLLGESGTGKELVARAIHQAGPRRPQPFIKVNCAALPENLLESELLGHEKGAFTGALSQKKGRFELADGGSLFLDEIGEMPLPLQAKLLRILQERTFERLGGTRSITVDVRIIAATNRNLEECVRQGSFRADLYYRLNVVPVLLPPLRERREDIPLLIEHFLAGSNRINRKKVDLEPEVVNRLLTYPWPGNIRELQNLMERLVIMSDRPVLRLTDLPYYLREREIVSPVYDPPADLAGSAPATAAGLGPAAPPAIGTGDSAPSTSHNFPAPTGSLQEMEKAELLKALNRCGWVQARAARALGLTPRQLGYRIKKHGITIPTNL